MKFEFSLIVLVGIFEYRDLFSFNRLIFVSISVKLKTPFLLHLVLIARHIHGKYFQDYPEW